MGKTEGFMIRMEADKYHQIKELADTMNLKLVDIARIACDALLDYADQHGGKLTLPLDLNKPAETLQKIATTYHLAEDPTPYSTAKPYELPLLGAAAAGSGISGDSLGTVSVSKNYGLGHYAVRVIGDSMDDGSPTAITDGSLAIVRRLPDGNPYAAKGRIYVWSHDGEQMLKLYTRSKPPGAEKSRGFLTSLNPKYPAISVTADMLPQAELIDIIRE